MSAIGEILTLVDNRVLDLLPEYKAAPFMYSPEDNERQVSKMYGLRVGSANSTPGTNNAVTLEHEIFLDLSQKYLPKKNEGDKDLRVKIDTILTDIEVMFKALYRRPGAIASASLLLISPLDVSEPSVDNDNNLVTITLTLNVKYRVAT